MDILFQKDTRKLHQDCRVMILTLLFALCHIDNVWTAKPTNVFITANPKGESDAESNGAYYTQKADAVVTLKCSAYTNSAATLHYKFLKNRDVELQAFSSEDTYTIAKFAAVNASSYTCIAKENANNGDVSDESPPLTLTLDGASIIAGVALTTPSSGDPIQDSTPKTLTCEPANTVSGSLVQFVKTGPGPLKVLRKFEANAPTFDVTFGENKAGTYGCRIIKPATGGIGIAEDLTLKFACTGTECNVDENAECHTSARYCTCKKRGTFSGDADTCNECGSNTDCPNSKKVCNETLPRKCVATKPEITSEPDQDSNSLGCGYPLKLICTRKDNATHLRFFKDYAPIPESVWTKVVTGKETIELKYDPVLVAQSGAYFCRAAADDKGATMSAFSTTAVFVPDCTACTATKLKCINDTYAECFDDKVCKCKHGGFFTPNQPTCNECTKEEHCEGNAGSGKIHCKIDFRKCVECILPQHCRSDKCENNVCKAPEDKSGARDATVAAWYLVSLTVTLAVLIPLCG